jgi:uncharacterized protein YecT (DUF1311 family)
MGISFVFLAPPAHPAEDNGKKSKTENLYDEKVRTEHQARQTEDKLNRLLDELQKNLPAEKWSALKSIQAIWEEFRNKDCSWERGFFEDGSAAPLVYGNCLETHDLERIKRLKLFLCEGYGMTGPCEASERY